jgi:VanZ family protein
VFNINKKNRYIITVLLWLLAIFCAVTIISFSSDPAHISKEKSGLILEKVEPYIERIIEKYHINFINLDELHFYIRKAAHVFIYFLLSVLLCLGWKTVRIKGLKPYYIAWFMATVFSIIDETYQLFIPGRSGEVRDVFLDNVGIILGLVFAAFSIFLFKKVKRKIIKIF